MAQPPSYNREKNFADDFGNETDHSALNAELDRASNSINDIRSNLAILQADDGKLRPAVVTADSISDELRVSLVEGVVMDAQSMLDRSLAAADASSKSAAAAKASETVALECKVSAVQSATTAQQSAAEAAESAGKAKQVNADWNATEGYAQILNKPSTLAGLELADVHTRKRSMTYQAGDVVIAPYLEDAILVCTTAGTTSGEELSRNIVIAGSDIEDGSVVWNVRDKFSMGLKKEAGTISLDNHASMTGEYGNGNEQYFGHVKVVDDYLSKKMASESFAISPSGVINAINDVMLGKMLGIINESTIMTCPVSGRYTVILVGGGGGGGGRAIDFEYGVGGYLPYPCRIGTGGGGGGGGRGEMKTLSVDLTEGEVINIVIGAGGTGGAGGSTGGNAGTTIAGGSGATGISGGNTSVTINNVTHVAAGGSGGSGGSGGYGFNTATPGAGRGGVGGASLVERGGDGSNGVYKINSAARAAAGGSGGNGGAGAETELTISQYGNGGGGACGDGWVAGIDGIGQGLAQSGSFRKGGNGANGVVYIKIESI